MPIKQIDKLKLHYPGRSTLVDLIEHLVAQWTRKDLFWLKDYFAIYYAKNTLFRSIYLMLRRRLNGEYF